MKIKKVVVLILLIITSLAIFTITSKATNDFDLELIANTNTSKIKAGETITVDVNISSIYNIIGAELYLDYDKDTFETLQSSDFEVGNIINQETGENVLENKLFYNQQYQILQVETRFNEKIIGGGTIVKIKLKLKRDIDLSSNDNEELLYINSANISDDEFNLFERNNIKISIQASIEKLYLSTTKYKIGEGDTEEQIRNYQKGDRFITQIEPNTTMQEFKSNLTTNGEMSIYNEDGTPITDEDTIIQTGMKLKVTKEDCEDIDLELALIGEEPLYLSTTTYQIGEGDTEELLRNYQPGDQFITKVAPNTTIEDFVSKLITNGTIKVFTSENIIETGTKITVEKEGCENIELLVIVDDEEQLYLLTNKYKIGEISPNKYDEGEKFINQVPANTKISDFIAELITNGNISVYNAKGEEVTELVDEQVITGMKLKVSKEGSEDIELTIIVDEQEELFLLTDIYKIGDKNQTIYELGDTCISKIPSKTSISEFIANLTTNGNISVYNAKGEEVTELVEEFVGTGMKLKVSKEGYEDIDLVISVIGDTSGDGLVQADDLADTVKAVLGDIELKEEQMKAIDVNDNGKIEADDLADEVKLVLE